MTTQIRSLSDLNLRNEEFYAEQHALFKKRMTDPTLYESARETLRYEQMRGVSAYSQTTLEAALETAERTRRKVLSQQARKGPPARKKDALTELIEQAVRSDPEITEARLLAHLIRLRCPGGVIEDIDEEVIAYNQYGRLKETKISALKDRLSRAREKVATR